MSAAPQPLDKSPRACCFSLHARLLVPFFPVPFFPPAEHRITFLSTVTRKSMRCMVGPVVRMCAEPTHASGTVQHISRKQERRPVPTCCMFCTTITARVLFVKNRSMGCGPWTGWLRRMYGEGSVFLPVPLLRGGLTVCGRSGLFLVVYSQRSGLCDTH